VAKGTTLIRVSDWEGVGLHVVTGKGGTGKTTVAAALALALAGDGRTVLLMEVEERQGLAQLFDTPPLPYEERWLAAAPGGGEVRGLAVDAHAAMYEYLDLYYRMGAAGKTLDRLGVVDFATTVAPGLRDVLLTGKTYEATRSQRREGQPVYDAVVLDAPPTGRITRFLDVNAAVSSLARIGPIHRQASSIMGLLRSPRTAVHIVTQLEEMPVQEAADAAAELCEVGIPLGAVVVNMVQPAMLTERQLASARAGSLDSDKVRAGLVAAGLDNDDETVRLLLDDAAEHAHRAALEKAQRGAVTGLERPTYELPYLTEEIDHAALYELAADLAAQGAA